MIIIYYIIIIFESIYHYHKYYNIYCTKLFLHIEEIIVLRYLSMCLKVRMQGSLVAYMSMCLKTRMQGTPHTILSLQFGHFKEECYG